MSETKPKEFWISNGKYENLIRTVHTLNPENSSFIHVVEASALREEKQKTKELLIMIVKYKEYLSSIESGEYNNNRRTAPLREFENVLQLQANELIKKYGDV